MLFRSERAVRRCAAFCAARRAHPGFRQQSLDCGCGAGRAAGNCSCASHEWDRFFAYAVFYREKVLSHPIDSESFKKAFIPQMISLEILALAKFCHWDEAKEIAETSLQVAHQAGLSAPEIESAHTFLNIQHQYPKMSQAKKGSSVPSSVFTKEIHWKIKHESIQQVSHPKFLKMKIAKRCEK